MKYSVSIVFSLMLCLFNSSCAEIEGLLPDDFPGSDSKPEVRHPRLPPVPESLRKESSVCWTLFTEGDKLALHAVGMDSGMQARVMMFENPNDAFFHFGSALAYDGASTMVAKIEGTNGASLIVLDLEAQAAKLSQTIEGFSDSVTYHDGSWLMPRPSSPESRLAVFDSVESLLAQAPVGKHLASTTNGRVQAYEGILYTSAHSTDRLDLVNLENGESLGSVELEGYDEWVRGIGITDDYIHVMGPDRNPDRNGLAHRVARFDHQGRFINEAPLRAGSTLSIPTGLWCATVN